MIKSQIVKAMNEEMNKDSIPTRKLLIKFKKIKMTPISGKVILMQPLTKKQKDILTNFSIKEDKIKECLYQMHL